MHASVTVIESEFSISLCQCHPGLGLEGHPHWFDRIGPNLQSWLHYKFGEDPLSSGHHMYVKVQMMQQYFFVIF